MFLKGQEVPVKKKKTNHDTAALSKFKKEKKEKKNPRNCNISLIYIKNV